MAGFASENLSGKVVGITDGDTLTVLVDRKPVKVRLAEIDTPERGQPWASKAKQALSAKVYGEVVRVEITDTDRYGRTVGHLYLGDRHINREMIREGHAWVYRQYVEAQSLLEDEKAARESGEGLWRLPEAERAPPWEWRAAGQGRTSREVAPAESGESFTCGTKRYCREMITCAEARFYLEKCGLTRLDGDGDGVPCEAICR
jgi:endonuclease YncB( thermonuclease family)